MSKQRDDVVSDAHVTHHARCPKCENEGRDRSGNNAAHYSDGGIFCFAGHGLIQASETFKKFKAQEEREVEDTDMGNDFSPEYWDNLEQNTTENPGGFRSLSLAACRKYGVRHKINEITGSVELQYYPVTKNLELSGVRWRDLDKKFYRRGEVGKECDLFGQIAFQNTKAKRIIIACGEIDTITLYQTVSMECIRKGYGEVPVVCTTIGEGGYKQLQNQYKWLDTFERIVVCPDQDEAGMKHLHNLVKYLPKGKVFIMTLPRGYKDPNQMLEKKDTSKLLDLYYRAEMYSPSGIVGSDALFNDLYDFEEKPKLTFPPFMKYIQDDMLMGGIEFPSIVNIVAPSGCVDGDTEFLTLSGWKKIKDYEKGDVVAQVDPDTREVSFVTPLEYVKEKCKTLNHIKSRSGVDQILCDDHRSYLYLPDSNNFEILSTREIKHRVENNLPFAGQVQATFSFPAVKDQLKKLLSTFNGIHYSTDKAISDTMQFALHSEGRGTKYYFDGLQYVVEESSNTAYNFNSEDITITPYPTTDGYKYCFKVKSGALILRRNNKIYITGNCGKSTILNEIIYHWIMTTQYKVGILALESTRKEFSKLLASRHLHRKLALLSFEERKLLLEDTVTFNEKLFFTDEGDVRFYFMEELDGDINRIKELIELMIIACDCKIIVIDPLQDLFAGLTNEDQESFLGWLKLIVKRYEIIIVCINHIRKQDGKADQNKMYMESEIMGSSTIIKSSFFTMLLNRNKYLKSDNPMTNVTQIMISKNRQTGITGPANPIYYDNKTHLLSDFEEYKQAHPELFEDLSQDTNYS